MQTGSVKSDSLTHLYVVLEICVGGSCPNAVGIESLVQNKALEVRLIIKVEISVGTMNLTHSCIRTNLVYYFSCSIFHNVLYIVKIRILGAP